MTDYTRVAECPFYWGNINFAGWAGAMVGTRHALGMPGNAQNAAQHAGSIAWFDPTELMFTDAYEVPHPDCADPP